MAIAFKRGDLVENNGLLEVVVGGYGDNHVPEDHIAIWYGSNTTTSSTQKEESALVPEIWTVPQEYVRLAPSPIMRH